MKKRAFLRPFWRSLALVVLYTGSVGASQQDLSDRQVHAVLEKRMARWESLETIRQTGTTILTLGRKLRLSPSLVLAVIEHESGFNPRARSKAGARGLMQLIPATARTIGKPLGIAVPHGGPNLHDPVLNVTLGMHYLAQLQAEYGDAESTLAAYCLGTVRWNELRANPGRMRPGTVTRYVAQVRQSAHSYRSAR